MNARIDTPQGPLYRRLPLWRDANRNLVEVELAVRGFPRHHKYTLGSDLRRQAMQICRLVARAAQGAQTRAESVLLFHRSSQEEIA